LNPYANAHQAYTESSVLTAPPEKLVVMLYDGAIRFLNVAAAALRNGDQVQARDRIRKADAILDQLNFSLDMSHGELPARLRSIYLFCKRHLIQANIKKDPVAIETVVGLLSELREAWEKISHTATVAA
jgi:flagellar protein FliS